MDFPLSDDTLLRLERYFADLGTYLWDCRQRASFATYMLGLLSELPRKSVEPIAALFSQDPASTDAAHQRLLHFLCDAPWPDADLRRYAAAYALQQMTQHGPVQTLILDDTAFPKSGPHSVGVQRQYCGASGKVQNCQVVVSLTAATAHAQVPLDMQLYLPQKWLESPSLRRLARIPQETAFQTKPQLGLRMLAQCMQPAFASAVVLADAAFGDGEDFRAGVRALGLHYAVGIHAATTVQLLGNDLETVSVQTLLGRLPARAWRRYSWREGSGKKLSARFAFFPVRMPHSDDKSRCWLVLERRDGAVRKDRAHLSSLPAWIGRRQLVYLLKERYRTEALYRELKQELGLDQYEGRRYSGLNHHLTVAMCAYGFVVAQRDHAFPPCGEVGPQRTQPAAEAAA
jgi:SRSO17 transposase